ncbi:helix-turn-helix domain-containing protein [Listeria booriae]|uniref:helix-turn-helix domain-containing protein n=1 Tax=Listeria booriae TaxID=1552123 RepID=UPI0016289495|nr:helix-turn-helix domain-containing protein [Listeria booriae]MBC2024819.1 helix-turn-helix domain-containing protein [Listeria booriae]MBC2080165.1 helix-turn-helix domain-containing protein [Listeria booriae]
MAIQKYEKQLKVLNDLFLSTQEAIDQLGVSKQCFHSLVARGKIQKIRKGSAVLYYADEINERKHQQPSLRQKYRPFQEG